MRRANALTDDYALALMIASAREAGAIGLQFSRQGAKVFNKNGNSPVTEADLAIDEHLKRRLSRPYPTIGWLSEETTDDPKRLHCRRVWIVDPIDGTRSFIAGSGEWVISLALVEDGSPVVGVLLRPTTGDLYHAARGKGAFCNNRPLRCTDGSLAEACSVAGPKPYVDLIRKCAPGLTASPKLASLALRIAETAEGRIDIAFAKPQSHEWDTAAAALLLQEAGGCLASFEGHPILYNRPDPRHSSLIATGLMRCREVNRLLNQSELPSL